MKSQAKKNDVKRSPWLSEMGARVVAEAIERRALFSFLTGPRYAEKVPAFRNAYTERTAPCWRPWKVGREGPCFAVAALSGCPAFLAVGASAEGLVRDGEGTGDSFAPPELDNRLARLEGSVRSHHEVVLALGLGLLEVRGNRKGETKQVCGPLAPFDARWAALFVPNVAWTYCEELQTACAWHGTTLVGAFRALDRWL